MTTSHLDNLADCIGKMRFYVMGHSERLYTDISDQISRFRVIRALVWVELILLFAVYNRLSYDPSELWTAVKWFIIIILIVNFFAIYSRFGRYCRAVERSYLILLIDQSVEQTPMHEERASS
jgi:hypothetical protein